MGTYELSVDVSLYGTGGEGNLRVSERVQLNAKSFLELAEILGEFHKLAETLKERNA